MKLVDLLNEANYPVNFGLFGKDKPSDGGKRPFIPAFFTLSKNLYDKYKNKGHFKIINGTLYIDTLFVNAMSNIERGRGSYKLSVNDPKKVELTPSDVQLDFENEKGALTAIKDYYRKKKPPVQVIGGTKQMYPIVDIKRDENENIIIPNPAKDLSLKEMYSALPNTANIIMAIDNGTFESKYQGLGPAEKNIVLKSALRYAIKNPDTYTTKTIEKINNIINLNKEALDPVGKEDSDVNNDGKVNNQDKYLKNRRKKIAQNLEENHIEDFMGYPDHEAKMAKSELRDMLKNGVELYKMIPEDANLPGWMSAYITLASDYIHSVYESMVEKTSSSSGYSEYE